MHEIKNIKNSILLYGLTDLIVHLRVEQSEDPPEKVNNVSETIWAGDGMYKCVKGAR